MCPLQRHMALFHILLTNLLTGQIVHAQYKQGMLLTCRIFWKTSMEASEQARQQRSMSSPADRATASAQLHRAFVTILFFMSSPCCQACTHQDHSEMCVGRSQHMLMSRRAAHLMSTSLHEPGCAHVLALELVRDLSSKVHFAFKVALHCTKHTMPARTMHHTASAGLCSCKRRCSNAACCLAGLQPEHIVCKTMVAMCVAHPAMAGL